MAMKNNDVINGKVGGSITVLISTAFLVVNQLLLSIVKTCSFKIYSNF